MSLHVTGKEGRKDAGGRDRIENTDITLEDVLIIEATFVEERALRPKIQINVHSLDDLKRIAKHLNEILIKYTTMDKGGTFYYIILKDRYYIYKTD